MDAARVPIKRREIVLGCKALEYALRPAFALDNSLDMRAPRVDARRQLS